MRTNAGAHFGFAAAGLFRAAPRITHLTGPIAPESSLFAIGTTATGMP